MGYMFSYEPQAADYVIYKAGSIIKGLKTSIGNIISAGSDYKTVFMACHDDAPTATGANCFTKTGAYSLSAKLLVNRPFNIWGAGCNWNKGTVITLANNVNDNMIEFDGGGTNIYFPLVTGIMLDGNKANNASGSGLKLTADVSDGIISNIGVTNTAEHGISTTCARMRILNCWSEYCGKYGINAGGGSLVINGCHVSFAGYGGIYGTAGITLSNTSISGCTRNGLLLTLGSNVAPVSNCLIVDNSAGGAGNYSGIAVTSGTALISNCNISGANHKYNIELQASSVDCNIRNNYIGTYATADYNDLGTRNVIEKVGTESSANHTPSDAAWPKGVMVQFTDTIDGTGSGIWIKNRTPAWVKLG